MLKKRTVFVVGAGASFELGLPLGDGLRTAIAGLLDIRFGDGFRQTSGDYDICQSLRDFVTGSSHQFNSLLHKCWLLRDALPGAISIDNLVDAHRNDPDVGMIGNLAIAKSILEAERQSNLYHDARRDEKFMISQANGSWLIPLFQKLTENVAKEDAGTIFSNVDFIIFNYDRCLEFFLPRALAAYYGFTDAEADDVFKNAQIIHPYGQVGPLSRGSAEGLVEFGHQKKNLRAAAERIRTFSEGLRHDSHREKIEHIMRSAENVVFLGFAFHPINMSILKISGESGIQNVFGTTVGLAEAAVNRVREDVFSTLDKRLDDGHVAANNYLSEVHFENRGCSDFIYAHFRTLI